MKCIFETVDFRSKVIQGFFAAPVRPILQIDEPLSEYEYIDFH